MSSSPTSPLRAPEHRGGAPLGPVRSVAAAMGVDLYPWQERAVACGLDRDAGQPVRRRFVVSTPRRAGKTTLVSVLLTWRALTLRDAQLWYTAQTQAAASDWWRLSYVEALARAAVFAGRYEHRRSAGTEHTFWPPTGARLRVFPPDGDKVHGNDADLAVVDEAWRLSTSAGDQLTGALDPAGMRRPEYQLWVVSTVGPEPSGWLHDLMTDQQSAVLHYGCPPEVDPFDPALWPSWHPGYEDPDPTFRDQLTRNMTQAAQDMPRAEWLRAYANQWPLVSTAGQLTAAAWQAVQQTDIGDRADPLHVAYDAAWDRSSASVVAAWQDQHGAVRLELVDNRPGVAWLVPYLADVRERTGARLLVDSGSPARDVTRALQARGVTVRELPTGDYAAACARLASSVLDQTVTVRPDPALDLAVHAAKRRSIGDRWVWDRRTRLDVSPLTAATVASWAAATREADPLLV